MPEFCATSDSELKEHLFLLGSTCTYCILFWELKTRGFWFWDDGERTNGIKESYET